MESYFRITGQTWGYCRPLWGVFLEKIIRMRADYTKIIE